jgi:hypothetical protein
MTAAFSLGPVFEALHAAPRKCAGEGRVLMFIAARRREGVSTIARFAARSASETGTTYCIDLDLRRNALARAFVDESGGLGPKIDGRLNGGSFYRLIGANGQIVHEMSPAFNFHRVGRTRLYVGAFNARAAPQDGRVMLSAEVDYWNAARSGGATVILDAPALERTTLGLRVVRHADGVVMVVGEDEGSASASKLAKDELVAAGANVLGLVYNHASAPVMAIEKLRARLQAAFGRVAP